MAKGERREALMRIVVLIVSGIILWAWGYLAWLLIVVHWIYTLIAGKRIRDIAEFIEIWNTQTYRLLNYISGMSNNRPFPFGNLSKISKFAK